MKNYPCEDLLKSLAGKLKVAYQKKINSDNAYKITKSKKIGELKEEIVGTLDAQANSSTDGSLIDSPDVVEILGEEGGTTLEFLDMEIESSQQ